MKIQQVQNNNTNFQGLYGNKWAINGLNQQMKTNVDRLAQDYDVLVKKQVMLFKQKETIV